MPARAETGLRRKAAMEFRQLFEELVEVYGHPAETLFAIQGDTAHPAPVRISAAAILCRHRFPYAKGEETAPGEADENGQITLAWSAPPAAVA